MKTWEENVRKVVPYVPGEQPKVQNLIKLNTNENPYPPSPKVAEALKAIDVDCMRLYPDPAASVLVKGIADFYQLQEDQVFVGVGSDDVLAMIFMTFFNSQKPILFPDITYSFYDVWADMLRIPYETVPLILRSGKKTISGKTEELFSLIQTHRPVWSLACRMWKQSSKPIRM